MVIAMDMGTDTDTVAAAAIRRKKFMLEFERVVKASDSKAAVYVFVDTEKGHIVYLSQTGMMSVVEQDTGKSSKIRAAGFAIGQSDCSS
jgi:hypothetical protein